MKKRIVQSRKLLVASIGVASVLYACEKREAYPPGNLVAPPPDTVVTSGNLVAPPPQTDAAGPIEQVPAAKDAGLPLRPNLDPPGNLMPPPPPKTSAPKPAHPPGNLMPPPPPTVPAPKK